MSRRKLKAILAAAAAAVLLAYVWLAIVMVVFFGNPLPLEVGLVAAILAFSVFAVYMVYDIFS